MGGRHLSLPLPLTGTRWAGIAPSMFIPCFSSDWMTVESCTSVVPRGVPWRLGHLEQPAGEEWQGSSAFILPCVRPESCCPSSLFLGLLPQ